MSEPAIRFDEKDELDEVVANGAHLHIERMGDTHWWLAFEVDGHRWDVNLTSKRTIYPTIYEHPLEAPHE